MIPPIPPAVLDANPQFEKLHKQLTTQILNPDASTKSTSTTYESAAIQLQKHHVQAAKHDILKRTLHDILNSSNDDPDGLAPDLDVLVLNIATYLSSAPSLILTYSAHDLMKPEMSEFSENLHIIAPLISRHLQQEISFIVALSHPSNSRPSHSPHPTQSLTAQHTTTSRALTTTLTTYLQTTTTSLTQLIRHLELTTHGLHTRHTTAHTAHLSTVATALAAKIHLLSLQSHRAIYTTQSQQALSTYSTHLQGLTAKLDSRLRTLSTELEIYEDVGGDGGGEALKECARRYGVVLRSIKEVEGEIKRLQEDQGTGERQKSKR